MSLETDVQELTQATTDLLVAVNVSKATLDGKVDDAGDFATASLNSANASAASAATATSQATAAGTARTGAETARDAAVVAQNNAVAVVTGGTATLTPSATKIPLSDAQGKIAKGWLTNTDLVEQTDIGTGPNEIPLNQFLGELAYLDAQNIPTLGISVANAATANVTNLMQVTEISNAVPSLNLDFAKVKQLDPRITFTRASTGTYYDGKTVAKAEENLLLQSQTFSTGSWSTSNIAFVGNSATAPDGTNTATTITANGSGSLSHYSQSLATTSAGIATASIYVKTSTAQYLQIFFTGDGSSYANFDVVNGTVTASSGTATGSIVSVGNGWYRCIAVNTSTAVTGCGISIVSASTSGRIAAFTAAGTEAVFIWGAQLEQRASATAYTPTTTQAVTNYIPVLLTAASGVPRFEHNPVTGESLGLEIEEQRTNLLTYSEQFDNALWNKFASGTTSANATIAPDGNLTADLLTWTAANASGIYQSVASAFVCSMSVYAKAYSGSPVLLVGDDSGLRFASFNLATGALVSAIGTSSTLITPVGNGWYRLVVVFATSPSNIKFISGTGVAGSAYIWGAQLEAGAFATSYIPTVASQVTRAADSAVMTGANFSSWYRPDEGTIYSDSAANGQTTNGHVLFSFLGTASNYIVSGQYLPSAVRTLVVDANGTGQALLAGTSTALNKIAGAYKVNDFAASLNGAAATTDSSGSLPIVDKAHIGNFGVNGQPFTGTIKKITYYPQRLSNAELVEMTA